MFLSASDTTAHACSEVQCWHVCVRESVFVYLCHRTRCKQSIHTESGDPAAYPAFLLDCLWMFAFQTYMHRVTEEQACSMRDRPNPFYQGCNTENLEHVERPPIMTGKATIRACLYHFIMQLVHFAKYGKTLKNLSVSGRHTACSMCMPSCVCTY